MMMFYHYEDDRFKNIIDEFILSSSGNESITYTLKNIDVLIEIGNLILSYDIYIN